MANRYTNLNGNEKISETYDQINDGFQTVQNEMDAAQTKLNGIATGAGTANSATDSVIGSRTISDTELPTGNAGVLTKLLGWLAAMLKAFSGETSWRTAPATTLKATKTHIDDAVAHLTEEDHDKLDGIQEGAEVNQNAFSQVNNVPAGSKTDTFNVAGGTGITISTNPGTKTVTITATGEATPGAHGSSHNSDGADPIPDVVALQNQAADQATDIIAAQETADEALANIPKENILDNGNFHVWQKGTTAINLSSMDFVSDKWINVISEGHPTTITHSRRTLNPNEIAGCKYCYRVEWDAAESVLNENFRHMITQFIDDGYSNYVSNGSKITMKFLVRTNITGKRVAVNLHERYLTDAIYNLNGESFEVGTDWTEVSYTWDTLQISDTPVNARDSLAFQIYFAWGDYYSNRFEGIPESYRSAGWVEIAHVRAVVGDRVETVRQRSFAEELRACKRYFQKSWDYYTAVGTAIGPGWDGTVCSSDENAKTITQVTSFDVEMAGTPSVVLYDTAGNKDKITTKDHLSVSTFDVTPTTGVIFEGTKNFKVMHNGTVAGIVYHWTAAVAQE